jgi:hypothetical protein
LRKEDITLLENTSTSSLSLNSNNKTIKKESHFTNKSAALSAIVANREAWDNFTRKSTALPRYINAHVLEKDLLLSATAPVIKSSNTLNFTQQDYIINLNNSVDKRVVKCDDNNPSFFSFSESKVNFTTHNNYNTSYISDDNNDIILSAENKIFNLSCLTLDKKSDFQIIRQMNCPISKKSLKESELPFHKMSKGKFKKFFGRMSNSREKEVFSDLRKRNLSEELKTSQNFASDLKLPTNISEKYHMVNTLTDLKSMLNKDTKKVITQGQLDNHKGLLLDNRIERTQFSNNDFKNCFKANSRNVKNLPLNETLNLNKPLNSPLYVVNKENVINADYQKSKSTLFLIVY